VRCETNRQPLYWNFMYHSRIFLSVGVSVWYVFRNYHCTATIDSVLANSKTQNAFLFLVHAMFLHDCPLAVKPASTPQHLLHKKTRRDFLPIDMLLFGVTIPATVPQRSENPEGLTNYPSFNRHVCLDVVCLTAPSGIVYAWSTVWMLVSNKLELLQKEASCRVVI
jgi:hypothetical protein